MTTPSNPAQRPSPAIEGLLPCPFCGGSNIEALDNFDWICCQDCGASLEDVEPSARELWNTRSSSAAYAAAETDDLRKANEILHGLITNREAEIDRLRACLKTFVPFDWVQDGCDCDDCKNINEAATLSSLRGGK
jgi:Lar family restriction alleviation protein